MENNKTKSLLQIQMETLRKYLSEVKTEYVMELGKKIYIDGYMTSTDPYMCLYSNLKPYVKCLIGKEVNAKQIQREISIKAFSIDTVLGRAISDLFKAQTDFLLRCAGSTTTTTTLKSEKQGPKNDIIKASSDAQNARVYNPPLQNKYPLKQPKQLFQQKITPVHSPLRNINFIDLFDLDNQKNQKEDDSVYNIGGRYGQTYINGQNGKSFATSKMKDVSDTNMFENKNIMWNRNIDAESLKRKLDAQKILSSKSNPFSQGRSIVSSPVKSVSALGTSKPYFPPPPVIPKTTFFSVHAQSKSAKQTADKYFQDINSIRNLSHKSLCLCQTSCENIVLCQDSFSCIHCSNVYHTRCMKRSHESRSCAICHLKYLIPNKVAHEQIFVGVLRKSKKKHQIYFELSEQTVAFLKSKKDFTFRIQIRSFRLKLTTHNINLFPDSCIVSLNGKQLKQFKPLHKQSSLKYRKDQPISILKNYQTGENKLIVTQIHPPGFGGIDRIEPEDHLIGVYLIQQETLNATVERVIREYVTTFDQSKQLLRKSFFLNNSNSPDNSEEQVITCEVVKIPLTCALTTEKLKYPARGIFCKHFQCFDLRNYIMMTSSSSNPRWVCPICKASCYEYRIDCVITQILNQYTGCQKVQELMLYKDGTYDVLDRDEQPIDEKGNKQKIAKPKLLSQLKIQDRLKRQRQKQAERQLLKLQQADQKKKKRIVELPPQDQIVDLLSDSD